MGPFDGTTRMAEILIGPLLTLSGYLAKWAWEKYWKGQKDKEYTWETEQLLKAVRKLQELVHERANAIKKLQQEFDFARNSFRIISFGASFDVRNIKTGY
jgi:hypothetical protein